jgi:hypothetical protein
MNIYKSSIFNLRSIELFDHFDRFIYRVIAIIYPVTAIIVSFGPSFPVALHVPVSTP